MSQQVLRDQAGGEQQVTPFELFFDLVFVFAVTQLSHTLLDHVTTAGHRGVAAHFLAIGLFALPTG